MRWRFLTKEISKSTPGYNLVLIVAVLTATVTALRIAFNLGYSLGTFEHSEQIHRTCCVNFEDSFLISLLLGLIVTAVSLLTRRVIGMLFSMLGLFWVVVVYIQWYRATLSIIRKAEVDSFSRLGEQAQYLLPLDQATQWDVAVLAIVILLLSWHIASLVFTIKRSARRGL